MKKMDSSIEIIDIEKGNNKTKDIPDSKWDNMSNDMRVLVDLFFIEEEKFESNQALEKIESYIKNHDRLLYTVISDKIYAVLNERDNKGEQILTNIDFLLEEIQEEIEKKESNKEKDDYFKLRTIVIKIKDHANLAIRQYNSLKQTDEEYKEKFNQQIGSFKEDVMKEITSQLITLVGIFTAIAFILFGGIGSFNSIFTSLEKVSVIKIVIISSLWTIGMSDIVFIFLLGISKMTNLDIGDKTKNNILERYIWIIWFNAIFVSIFIAFLWINFGIKIGVLPFDSICGLDKKGIFYIGTIIILIVIMYIFRILFKKTKRKIRE